MHFLALVCDQTPTLTCPAERAMSTIFSCRKSHFRTNSAELVVLLAADLI